MPQLEKNGVKTLMGVKRFEVHFRAIFLTDHKVASNRQGQEEEEEEKQNSLNTLKILEDVMH